MERVQNGRFVDASILTRALTEAYPESTYGSVPSSEYEAVLDVYQEHEENVFDEVPLALDVYLEHQNGLHA